MRPVIDFLALTSGSVPNARAVVCVSTTNSEGELASERQKKAQELEATLEGMRERERRAFLRKQEKEKGVDRGEGEGNDGFESFDEDEDEGMDDDDL